jgi:hypothetical protein
VIARYRCDMPDSPRDRAAAGDRAAELNDQVAEGHEWAARSDLDTSGDLHENAATKHRRTAGKDRFKAKAARAEPEEQTD